MIRTKLEDFILRFGEDEPISVTVPTTLYSAYESAGRLPDLRTGLSMKAYERLAGVSCEFVSVFEADEELLSHRHIALRLHGVLPSARVYVNGTMVGECKSMHVVYTFDVKSALVLGENTLTVKLLSRGDTEGTVGRYAPFLTDSETTPPVYDRGIYRAVELLAYDACLIDGVTLRQEHTDMGVTLHIQTKFLGESEDVKAVATLVSPGGKMYYSGLHRGAGSVLVADPEYWWPRGLGAQALYRLGITLYAGGEPEDAVGYEVGLRTVEISERDEDGEREFALLVNGVRFFATGADYMPEDVLLSRIDLARTERLVRAAADANINLLRIGEGTVYPTDDFYRLCDRYGILVYQELMATGNLPELSEAEEAAYLSETAGALRRFATHPSLAVIATHYNEENNIRKIPSLVEMLAPDAVYKNFLHERNTPLAVFDTTSAFPTLSSPVSLPDAKTLASIGEGEIPNPYSRTLEYHAREISRIASMFSLASERYYYANNSLQMIYLTQLNAADLITQDIAYLRRRRTECMGAFALRLNDSWTSVTGCAIDCYARPKLSLTEAGKWLAPLSLGVYREGYRVSFMLFNDTRTAFDGYLTYTLADARNNVISEATLPVHAEGGSGEEIVSVDFSTQVFGHESEYYLTARIYDDAGVHSERTVLFTRPKYFEYQNPETRARIEGYGNDFEIILSASAFAHRVYLSFSETDAVFEDNAIDITKNLPIRVRARTEGRPTTAEELTRQLRILSVYDLGR